MANRIGTTNESSDLNERVHDEDTTPLYTYTFPLTLGGGRHTNLPRGARTHQALFAARARADVDARACLLFITPQLT